MLINREQIVATAAKQRLPAIYPYRYFVASGGLVSYSVDLSDLYRRAASYVDRILRGERPTDLPVQQPTKFELVINLKTANALGLDSAADAARPRRRGDRMRDARGRCDDETSPPTISASGSGRCRAAGRLADREGASLSVAAGAHRSSALRAGSAADIVARLIGQWLSERLGQPFVIENRPGAGSNIATEAVVQCAAGRLHAPAGGVDERDQCDALREAQFQFHPRHRAGRGHHRS